MANTKIPIELSSTPGIVDNSDATAITIDSSENVGIGVTTPFSQTQITETGWSSGAPYGTVLTVTGNNTNDANWGHLLITDSSTGTGNGGMLRFATGSTSSDISPFAGFDGFTEGANYGGLKFLTRANGGTATERMRIDSSGNVGIGTSIPAEKLEVSGDIKATKIGMGISPIVPCEVLSTGATSTALRVLKSGSDDSTQNNLFSVTEISGHGRLSIHDSSQNEDIRFDSNGNSYFNGGNVGIGTASPADLLHLVSAAPMLKVEATNDSSGFRIDVLGQSSGQAFRVLKDTSTTLFTVDTSGNVTAAGSISDERLKEDISLIDNPLDKIKELKGITYKLKKSGYIGTGLIAQDLQKVLPEAVYEVNEPEKNDESYLAISYGNTVGLLVESIKEQQVIIEDLQTQINEVKNGN